MYYSSRQSISRSQPALAKNIKPKDIPTSPDSSPFSIAQLPVKSAARPKAVAIGAATNAARLVRSIHKVYPVKEEHMAKGKTLAA